MKGTLGSEKGKTRIVTVINKLEVLVGHVNERVHTLALEVLFVEQKPRVFHSFNTITDINNHCVFSDVLGLPGNSLQNSMAPPDDGGKHPDLNTVHPAEFASVVIIADSAYDNSFVFYGEGARTPPSAASAL